VIDLGFLDVGDELVIVWKVDCDFVWGVVWFL